MSGPWEQYATTPAPAAPPPAAGGDGPWSQYGGSGAPADDTPPPAHEVGVVEGAKRGIIRGAGQAMRGLGILAAGPVERLLSATGSDSAGKLFSAADDFGKWGDDATETKPGETYTTGGKIARAVGEGVPAVAGAVYGGAPVAGMVAGGAGAANTFAEGLQNNLNAAANIAKTVIAGVGGAISGYAPGSIGASIPVKALSGAAINVGSGEAQRQASNAVNAAADRPDLNQDFDPYGAAGAALVGGALGAAPHAGTAAGDAAIAGARKVLSVDPELAKVAQKAGDLKYPIDVRPDQVVDNAKFTKLAGQASSDVPLSNSKTASNQVAYTRNLIDLLNPEEKSADRLTPETFDKAMNRSGSGIGDIMAKTSVPLDAPLTDSLSNLHEDVTKFGTENDQRILSNYIDEVKSKAGDDGVINGTALKELNSEIGTRARAEAGNDLGRRLNDLQDVIQDAVQRNVDPEDAQPLRDFRRQYAYGKIVEPLVAKTIDGKVSPSALMARVTATKQGKQFMARNAGGPIGDLAQVGQLIKEPGSSGTAERNLVYGALGGAAALEPHTAAAAYGGALAYNTLGPKLTRRLVRGKAEPVEPPAPPPAEPTTSLGASGGGAPSAPAAHSPLGDLTPDWGTTLGVNGRLRPGEEPGFVPAVGETVPMKVAPGGADLRQRRTVTPVGPQQPGIIAEPPILARQAGGDIPAVPGRPDLPDTLISGGPAESAATEGANAAMHEPGAIEARRQQAEPAPRGPVTEPTEIERVRAESSSPAVQKVLDDHQRAAEAEQGRRETAARQEADAAELERVARTTTDSALQARLLKQADVLRKTEPIPTGKVIEGAPPVKSDVPTKPLPKADAAELTPELVELGEERLPTGEATEITPELIELDRKWRAEFKLGNADALRARDVARALAHDAGAVEKAATQHARSPRAFDREIARINDEGEARANESNEPTGRGQGNAEGTGASDRSDRVAPVRAGEGDGDGSAPIPSGEAPGKPASAVRAADQQPGADRTAAPAAGRGSVDADAAGGPAERLESRGSDPTSTPEFKRWFGDSKVVDARGKPQVVYHGTNGDFSTFDRGASGKGPSKLGFWFTDQPDFAENFGHTTVPAYASLENPKVLTQVQWDAMRMKHGGDASFFSDLRDQYKAQGYDGVMVPGGSEKVGKFDVSTPAVFAAFEPEQIKSAIGNNGKFDPTKASILEKASVPAKRAVGSAAALDQVLRDKFGDKLIQGLHDQGVLKYTSAAEEGQTGPRRFVQALMHEGGGVQSHASLYFDRLTAEEAPNVLMHELGEHFGIVRLLGDRRYRGMLSDLRQLRRTTPEVRDAWNEVKKLYVTDDSGIREGDTTFMREVAAHLVEAHPDMPFVRRLIAEIRAFFYEKFGTSMGNRVDADLVRGLAAAALRKASSGELPRMNRTILPSEL